ncbi:MAG: hypothetical protein RLZZ444_1007 [Pseudomonadota bacterium]|jgi:RimJ/RimL family protein N-acetyltransferase
MPIQIRRAKASDIDRIMEIERLPGFEALVGRSARSIHETLVDDPTHAYLLATDDADRVLGFAILREIGSEQGNIYLKRIAMAETGKGLGSAFLDRVLEWAFSLPGAHRVWLDHFADNHRAHRAYEKVGFLSEGLMRQAYKLPDGSRADLVMMAVLKPEWSLKNRL